MSGISVLFPTGNPDRWDVAAFNLLLDGGKVREELYLEDRLHLNDDGYKLWADMLAPHWGLKQMSPK